MGEPCAYGKRFCARAVESSLSGFPHCDGGCTARLRTYCSEGQHVFWTDSVSVREDDRFRWNHVQGHRQVTDVYLLALAVDNDGRLATFDSTISLRAVERAEVRSVEVIGV